jgi:hypothetical protein
MGRTQVEVVQVGYSVTRRMFGHKREKARGR